MISYSFDSIFWIISSILALPRLILDDDPIWKGRKLSKIRVNEAIYLKNKKIIKNNLFVICNISSNVLNKIKNKLLKLNIKKDKIVCFDL